MAADGLDYSPFMIPGKLTRIPDNMLTIVWTVHDSMLTVVWQSYRSIVRSWEVQFCYLLPYYGQPTRNRMDQLKKTWEQNFSCIRPKENFTFQKKAFNYRLIRLNHRKEHFFGIQKQIRVLKCYKKLNHWKFGISRIIIQRIGPW